MILIGAKIQEHRRKQELSQEEFAVRVGVTRQAVSKWETDKAYPDLDKLVTICEILRVSITDLVYGEEPATFREPADGQATAAGQELEENGMAAGQERKTGVVADGRSSEESRLIAGQEPKTRVIAAGKARGRLTSLRLLGMLALTGGMFLFCGALLAAVLTHHAWKKEDSLSKPHTRVERVYRQYTKADVSFLDNVSRRVTETVWLDVPGIREGDYLVCYSDGEQRNVYYEYHGTTLIVLAAAELVFFLLLLACIMECRRLARENKWYVVAGEAREDVEDVPADEAKDGTGNVPADGTKENAGR